MFQTTNQVKMWIDHQPVFLWVLPSPAGLLNHLTDLRWKAIIFLFLAGGHDESLRELGFVVQKPLIYLGTFHIYIYIYIYLCIYL